MKKELSFIPAQAGRASEDVALQIEAAIMDGSIQPGESLPSERELQQQFETGRGVVREAIRTLKQKGLIEVKKGAKGGAFVRQVKVANVSESLALFLKQSHVNPQHLIEFRESLDRTITSLAIARGSHEQKQTLVAQAHQLQQAAQVPEPDMLALGEMDRQLNILLAQMTGNPIFEWVMRALQSGFSSYDYALYKDAHYRQETVANWRATAEEIAAGEPLRALAYIGHHYVLLHRCVQQQQQAAAAAGGDDNPQ